MTGGWIVDIVLLLVLATYAYSGYRQGLVSSIFALLGFVAGALIGIWQLPRLVAGWDAVAEDPRLRVAVLIIGVIALGWLGQLVGGLLGADIRRRMGMRTLRRADSVLGALAVTVAAAVIIGFLASSLRGVGSPSLARATADSRVLQVLDRVVPGQTSELFASFRGFLSAQGFPQVFGGPGREPIAPVDEPDAGVASSPQLQALEQSVLKVTTRSDACRRDQEGTGWVVSPERVVTNAHVIAGASTVYIENDGLLHEGVPVVFDSARDLAVVAVPSLDAPALPLGAGLEREDSAVIPGFPLDGPYTVVAARVRNVLDARGLDIYGQQRVVREIYSLRTRVRPGNSGGPLVDPSGRVVGVVFAKSVEDEETGYALTLDEARPVLEAGVAAGEPVGTGACLAR